MGKSIRAFSRSDSYNSDEETKHLARTTDKNENSRPSLRRMTQTDQIIQSLFKAVELGDTIHQLIALVRDCCLDVSLFEIWDNDTGYNLIHQACHYRNVELVFYLTEEINRNYGYVKKIEYVNLKSDNEDQYFTPLHLACYTGEM